MLLFNLSFSVSLWKNRHVSACPHTHIHTHHFNYSAFDSLNSWVWTGRILVCFFLHWYVHGYICMQKFWGELNIFSFLSFNFLIRGQWKANASKSVGRGKFKIDIIEGIPHIEHKLYRHYLWPAMCFRIHSPGFDLNEQISNSLTTCHPVRFQKASSFRTGDKDNVMMLLHLYNPSDELAFEE